MSRRLGIVTIGQSPRPDVVPEIAAALRGVDVVEAGALDGAGEDEIAALAPQDGEPALATRLADGRAIAVAKPRLLPRLEAAIQGLAPGCGGVMVLCSGHFPPLAPGVRLYYPDGILHGAVRGLMAPGEVLGVVSPLASQAEVAGEAWADVSDRVAGDWASPYGAERALVEALGRLDGAGAGLMVLDCMGFGRRHLALARRTARAPVVAAPALVAAEVV
jgi:protein AroM